MPVNLEAMRQIILQGLTADPETQKKLLEEAAQRAKAEIEYYNSLTSVEKDEYDRLTLGMMPRIPR